MLPAPLHASLPAPLAYTLAGGIPPPPTGAGGALLANGAFDDDTGWTIGTNWNATGTPQATIAGGVLTLSEGYADASLSEEVASGTTLRVTFTASGGVAAILQFFGADWSIKGSWEGTPAAGVNVVDITLTGPVVMFDITALVADSPQTFDDIAITVADSNLLPNGQFDSADGWTLTGTYAISGGVLSRAGGAASNATGTLTRAVAMGATVRVTYDLTVTTGTVNIGMSEAGGAGAMSFVAMPAGIGQTVDLTPDLADATGLRIRGLIGSEFSVDNVTVVQINDAPAGPAAP